LLQRWGIAPTTSVWIGGNDLDARKEIEVIAGSFRGPPETPIDCAFITPKIAAEAAYFAKKLSSRLVPGAPVWVAWGGRDCDGMADVSAGLSDAGFEEFGQVTLSSDYVTIGFRRRL